MTNKTRRISALTSVLVAGLIAASPASAAPWVDVKTSPKNPIVDDSSIVVSWKTNRALKAGQSYEVTIMGASGRGCASFVTQGSKRRPTKGKRMSIRLSSYDDIVHGGREWCQGKASVTVKVRKGKGGGIIGMSDIRFRSKP